MALLRWDPWGELSALQRDVNELFTRVSPQATTGATARGGVVPPIDAFRTDEGLVVRAELPGLAPSGVEVSVNEGVLTISGERVTDEGVAEDGWIRRERAVGVFERSFTLPEGTDPDSITASFENGVLELHIPHPPESQPHKIEVSSQSKQEAIDVGEGSGS